MKVDAVVGDATPKEKRSSSSSSAIVWVGCLGGEGRGSCYLRRRLDWICDGEQ